MDAKIILRVVITLFVFTVLALNMGQFCSTESGISAQRQALKLLDTNPVVRVSITALNADETTADDVTTIRDSSKIAHLVKVYQTMPRLVGRDSRLTSDVKVNVTFEFADGRKLESFVSHNDHNNLVFIPTQEHPEYQSSGDFFASKELTPILFQ